MTDSSNPFKARWTAKGHTLCLGHWEISFEDKPIELPQKQLENHMNTFGIFSFLFPDDEDLAEGLLEEEWVEKNIRWLYDIFEQNNIPLTEQYFRWLYQAINPEDWRCGSCGGCL